jgi:hypothetical protein
MWNEIDRLLATTAVAWGFVAVRGRDGRIRLKRARAQLEGGSAAIDAVLRRTDARRRWRASVDGRVVAIARAMFVLAARRDRPHTENTGLP